MKMNVREMWALTQRWFIWLVCLKLAALEISNEGYRRRRCKTRFFSNISYLKGNEWIWKSKSFRSRSFENKLEKYNLFWINKYFLRRFIITFSEKCWKNDYFSPEKSIFLCVNVVSYYLSIYFVFIVRIVIYCFVS